MRYQICYCKTAPLTTWTTDKDKAVALAAQFRAQGYEVMVWVHDDRGARLTKI